MKEKVVIKKHGPGEMGYRVFSSDGYLSGYTTAPTNAEDYKTVEAAQREIRNNCNLYGTFTVELVIIKD